jgi:AcrR family transcriptional regulator
MARPRNEDKRLELRTGSCDYLLRVGVGAADLGEMAEELETSPRMLVHYFGSRDELINEALEVARDQQRSIFREWFAAHQTRTVAGLLLTFWDLMPSQQAQPYLRLFSEVYSLAVQRPGRFRSFSTHATVHDWLSGLEGALQDGGADEDDALALATLVLAVQRGLLLDSLGTGEHERVKAAHDALLGLLDAPSSSDGEAARA